MPRFSYLSPRGGVRPTLPALCCAALLLAAAGGCRSGSTSASSAGRTDTASADALASPGSEPRGAEASRVAASGPLTVVVVGNSLAAGYGLSREQAFPALLEQKADSAGLERVNVVNAGVSGETTAGGRRRIDWLLQREDLDVLLLELGANDALRGLSPDSARANLRAIIAQTRQRFPGARIVLAGMKAPPNMGTSYTARFEQLYPRLAEETGAALVPFLLDGVAGQADLNQPDGLHPTAEGQQIVARTVWETLGPLLHQLRTPSGSDSSAVS